MASQLAGSGDDTRSEFSSDGIHAGYDAGYPDVVCAAMTTIHLKNPRQCQDILPVHDTYGSGLVTEHRCILDAGHDGMHRGKNGNAWVNTQQLMRMRGIEM